MKLTKTLQASLCQLAAAGCSWTTVMDEPLRRAALKLERLGLVKLLPRYTGQRARGQCRGRLDGYDVVVTAAGKDLLCNSL